MTDSKNRKSWASTTTWLLSANIARNIGLIAILILLARLTNSTAVGDYALALAITTPIFGFFQLGLKGVVLTLNPSVKFSFYLKVQTAAMLLAIVGSLSLGILISPRIELTIFLVSIWKCIDATSELCSAPLQKMHRPESIFYAYLVSALGSSLLVALVLINFQNLNIALIAIIVISGLSTYLLMWRNTRVLISKAEDEPIRAQSTNLGLSNWKRIVKAGAPLGFSTSVLALMLTVPQYQLSAAFGTSQVGYLAVVLYALAVVDIFLGTLTQAWIPKAQSLAELHGGDSFQFTKKVLINVGIWTAVVIPLALIGVSIMSVLMPIFLGRAYELSWEISIPLLICIVLSPAQHFTGVSLVVRNMYGQSLIPSLLGVGASAISGVYLIPEFSASGALWSISIGLAVRGISTTTLLAMTNKHQITKYELLGENS